MSFYSVTQQVHLHVHIPEELSTETQGGKFKDVHCTVAYSGKGLKVAQASIAGGWKWTCLVHIYVGVGSISKPESRVKNVDWEERITEEENLKWDEIKM